MKLIAMKKVQKLQKLMNATKIIVLHLEATTKSKHCVQKKEQFPEIRQDHVKNILVCAGLLKQYEIFEEAINRLQRSQEQQPNHQKESDKT